MLQLTTSPWAGSQAIHRWLNCWITSARSLGGTQWTEELQDHRKKGDPRGKVYQRIFAGYCSRNTVACGVTRGSVPGSTTGWITAASTTGTFAFRSDPCGYACRHGSNVVREA